MLMQIKSFRSFWKSAFICAFFCFASVSASAFKEGVDYQVLETPIPNAQGTLIKIFSYDCPFCYRYDKSIIGPLMEQLGSEVRFVPFHLDTKGTYGPQASELFAVLIIRDQDNGVDLLSPDSWFKKAKIAYYQAYHDRKERWNGGADEFLQTGLDAVGMTRAQFDQAKTDPRVQQMLDDWKVSYDIAKIQGVPAFVVNGRYLINTKSIQSVDGMAALIRELASKP